MTERVLGPTGGRRRKRLALLVPFLAIAALVLAIGAPAAVTQISLGFEGADANLVPGGANTTPNFDWNSFSTVTWPASPAAPYRQATKTVNSWDFTGIEDDQNSGSDTVFGGGTKQDDACANIGSGPKPPNKDDLKRIYIASRPAPSASGDVLAGDIILAIAWERITQNTTSASAHVGFEFNQSANACSGSGHGGLVERTVGDILIVYDFEGSSTDAPTLKLLRWQITGTCEQTNKTATSAGCWVLKEANLVGAGSALAAVYVAPSANPSQTILDKLAPPASGTTSVDQNIGDREFGEAVINLSAAGVFPRGGSTPTNCLTLGKGFGVSRSSGDSGTAAMKDIAGPAPLRISNCGSVTIRKATSPADSANPKTQFSFTNNMTRLPPGSTDNTVGPLTDGGSTTFTNVAAGTGLYVTETDPSPAYALTSITCTSGSTASYTTDVQGRTLNFSLLGNQTLDCTFTNTKQKQPSTINTAPWVYPNDTATVGPSSATGNVTFKLFGPTGGATPKTALQNCQANGTDAAHGLLYSESVSLPGSSPNAASTSNYKNAHTPDDSLMIDADKTVYWRVEYGGSTEFFGRVSDCEENIAIDVQANTTAGGTAPSS